MQRFLAFVYDAPADQNIINMDCNDHCEDMARLAEQVAAGANICDLLPEFEHYMKYWKDCREEFEALVAVLRAEQSGELEQ
jgi:hypothetical protein